MKTAVSLTLIVFSVLILSGNLDAQKAKSLASSVDTQKSNGLVSGTLAATGAKSTRFENVGAVSDGRSTWLTWQMEVEIGNIGFNVYRVGRRGAELLTPVRIVQGAALQASEIPSYGDSYFFYDETGTVSSSYYVETIGMNGQRIASQTIYPRYVPSLSAATGITDEQMRNTTFRPTRLETETPVFTKDIRTEMEQYRQLADGSTHRMVISQPGVARIGVKREGLYRVTSAQLMAAGFDVTSNSANWQLYIEGVEQAIIVGPAAAYIEFYGRGTDTRETDIRQYYLMNGSSAGKRMGEWVAHPNTSTVLSRSYSQTFVKKERTQYVEDIFNGQAENYYGRAVTTNPNAPAMTFDLTGIDFGSANSTMQLRFQGYVGGAHLIEVILNGETLAPVMGSAQENFTADYTIPTSFLREGSNSIKFRAMGSASDFVFFDTMKIGFNRIFLAQANTLNFYTQNYRATQIGGFTSPNIRIFDITRDGNPLLMTNLTVVPHGPTFGIDMPAERGRSFFAVEDSAILAADSVTRNNPELVGIPTNAADLVIISYKDFMPQAEAWAEYRRAEHFNVKVVEVSELYDEFNFGALSADAVKNFLRYTYENWQTAPRYVLIIGDASWDSRNYENTGNWNFVTPEMVPTIYSETASDDALADFNNDGLAEMAVGRVAARTATEVNTIFTKTVNWESSLSSTSLAQRGALFAHDFNNGYTFDVMSQRLANQLPAGTPSTFVFRGETDANTNLITAMNTGKYIVNYSGHGTAGSWGGNPLFFNVNSVVTTTDHSPSVYTMLTCLNGYYHWLYFPSIAEVLMNTPNKGAVVTWASSAKTLPNFQEDMATRFYTKIGDGDIPRIGDLIRDAKTQVIGADLRYSWGLLGDPMLKVR
ncbi:MAG: hypothetical protein DMF63_13655 [Acidobacteria bacterium]|nr:MAG: hypothetical protein DMF63_13655 [Acidobacteriota bacterium]